ncbi:RNA polymerase-associated protein [Escherichia coli]|uniref:RNA polymerase-associated protein n=1 Tax=Escherichia coli TaxID=562 RepID=A0A2X1JLE8_ECOLX|nr:RNA polymerase-associated protein [Escherichia coli]
MLMDRHGTSRVLFRNTRNGVKGFPKRELHTIKLRYRRSIRRLLKSPALWAHVKVRKIVLAICSTRSVFIRNLKVITPPGGTSIRALSG